MRNHRGQRHKVRKLRHAARDGKVFWQSCVIGFFLAGIRLFRVESEVCGWEIPACMALLQRMRRDGLAEYFLSPGSRFRHCVGLAWGIAWGFACCIARRFRVRSQRLAVIPPQCRHLASMPSSRFSAVISLQCRHLASVPSSRLSAVISLQCRHLASVPSSRFSAVIPAKAGIHFGFWHQGKWIPAFAGMTALRRDDGTRANGRH